MREFAEQRQISRTAVALILIGTTALVLGVPYAYEVIFRQPYPGQSGASRFLMAASKGLTIFFVSFVGASIGSFINVVAYRMPLGISVVHSGSSCPRCRSQIQGRDNIPVFGWLLLGGRCRNCGLAISPRYPLVEFWFGLYFFALVMFELITSAGNLPGPQWHNRTGVSETIWYLKWNVIGVFLFHCFLVGTLSTWSLFKLDRNPIPGLAGLVPVLLALGCGIAFPALHPVSPWLNEDGNAVALRMGSPLLGLAGGLAFGAVLEWLLRHTGFNRFPGKGLVIGAGFTGLALGWQAMLSACLLFSLFYFFSRFLADAFLLARGPVLGIFTLAVLVQICFWESLANLPYWPGSDSDLTTFGVGVLAPLVCLLAAHHLLPFEQEIEEFESRGYGEYDSSLVEVPPDQDVPLTVITESANVVDHLPGDHGPENPGTENPGPDDEVMRSMDPDE